jgi:hypothetical protein
MYCCDQPAVRWKGIPSPAGYEEEARGMRTPRFTVVSVVLLAVPFVAGGCGGNGHTRSSAQTTTASAEETANIIRATERQRLHALLHHDIDTAQKLHASNFELINPLGEAISREDYIDSGAAFSYTEWKPVSPIRVRVHGDSAVIRYESEIELHGTRGHYWHTDLYEKRNRHWKIVWSQTTGAP